MRLKRYTEATNLFSKAIEERPHLLNYVLLGLKLEHLEWITNGNDMRTWINRIRYLYNVDCPSRKLERTEYISSIMNREIDQYIQCLFYMSFLKDVSGYSEESKDWFAKIRFLENDYGKLHSWLARAPLVKSNRKMLSLLNSFDNLSLYVAPDCYRDRYKFGKFLFKLIFSTL